MVAEMRKSCKAWWKSEEDDWTAVVAGRRRRLLYCCWTTMRTLSHFPEDCGRKLVTFVSDFSVSRHFICFLPLIVFNTQVFFNFPAATGTMCSIFVEHRSLLACLYESVVVGHVVCMSVCMLEGVRACQIGLFLFCCVSACRTDARAQRRRRSASKSVLHKKEKSWNLYIFSKRAAFFSPVNNLNEIYRYEYIL